MILTELAQRNLAAALRETLNIAMAIEHRQSKLEKYKSNITPEWVDEELRKHVALCSQLNDMIKNLEEMSVRIRELRDF